MASGILALHWAGRRCHESILQLNGPSIGTDLKPMRAVEEDPATRKRCPHASGPRADQCGLVDLHGRRSKVHVEADLVIPPYLPAGKTEYGRQVANRKSLQLFVGKMLSDDG